MAGMKSIGMEYDDLAWEKSESMFEAWNDKLYTGNVSHNVAMLAAKYRQGVPVHLNNPVRGSFNACLQVEFSDKCSAMIRFAVGGQVMFPEEKVRTEVAVMQFIADTTTIPIPFVFHMGTVAESIGGLGPFIVMEYIKHKRTLSRVLEKPGRKPNERPVLNPDISQETLRSAYSQIGTVVLQLSRPTLRAIGSFSKTDEFEWSVTERPMIFDFNALVQMGGVLPGQLPISVFYTAASYYIALADIQLEHLYSQHNDAVLSEEDCRQKYVARCLFQNLAAENRLDMFPEFNEGPFRLICEDLRPMNFLTNENDRVVGVVDWEFTYSAPAGFAFSPPWWLLLERPEYWPWGLDSWEKEYTGRLETWLEVLEAQELVGAKGISEDTQIPLSARMKEAWKTGAFWINYALQNSWAFDKIYFSRLDEKFFGTFEGDWLTQRLPLLTETQRSNMEPFVTHKMAQKADRRLADNRFDEFL